MNIKSINNIELTNIKSYNNVLVKNIHSVNNILQNYAFNLDLSTFKDTVSGHAITGNPTITAGWLLLEDSLYIDNLFYDFPLLYQSLHGKVESGVRV